MPTRTPEGFIDHFVTVVLNHIDREYPNKLDHVINDPAELRSPRDLHPIFFGSFDWHSSVHGHWLLTRALRSYPTLAQATEVRVLLDRRFTAENVKTEIEYLGHKRRETFERTYGWAWLLKLAAEVRLAIEDSASARKEGKPPPISEETGAAFTRWDSILAPLAASFVDRYLKYLPKATYPIRVGTHTNTAFGLAFAHDYAIAVGHQPLADLVAKTALTWYAEDKNYPAWEPDGTDFFSPGLIEAECMRRVLGEAKFLPWFDRFLPNLGVKDPITLFKPAFVSDRTDGQITHLDGLNLSRAWCWRSLARVLPESDPRRGLAEQAYTTHLDAALPHVTGDYMGEHWLATFALLAMTE